MILLEEKILSRGWTSLMMFSLNFLFLVNSCLFRVTTISASWNESDKRLAHNDILKMHILYRQKCILTSMSLLCPSSATRDSETFMRRPRNNPGCDTRKRVSSANIKAGGRRGRCIHLHSWKSTWKHLSTAPPQEWWERASALHDIITLPKLSFPKKQIEPGSEPEKKATFQMEMTISKSCCCRWCQSQRLPKKSSRAKSVNQEFDTISELLNWRARWVFWNFWTKIIKVSPTSPPCQMARLCAPSLTSSWLEERYIVLFSALS